MVISGWAFWPPKEWLNHKHQLRSALIECRVNSTYSTFSFQPAEDSLQFSPAHVHAPVQNIEIRVSIECHENP